MDSKIANFIRRLLTNEVCPDEQALAAYADRQLIGADRHTIERHLSNCDACAGQVAFLVRDSEGVRSQIPDQLLASAIRMGATQPRQLAPSWKLVSAGVLVVVVGAVLSIEYPRHSKFPKPEPLKPPMNSVAENHPESRPARQPVQSPELRGSEVLTSPFLFPVSDQTVDATNLMFHWRAFANADDYEIELLTDDGTYVWGKRLSSVSVSLPKSVHLSKGASYFVKLRVHLANGSVEQTKPVAFIVG